MNIYILRHGEAANKEGYKEDSLRLLTKDGKEIVKLVAKAIKSMQISFDVILASPYLRAKQTAEIVANTFQLSQSSGQQTKKLKYTDNLIPSTNPKEMVKEITSKYANKKSILLVGHEPYLSKLINSLLHANISIELKKAGLCKLDVENLNKKALLCWILTAKQLSAIAKAK